MKKSLLLLILITAFYSCNPQEKLFEQANTITFKMPAGKTTAYAIVSNTYPTVVNTDTLINKTEYLWDELDDNGNQVGNGLYKIEIKVDGNVIATGTYAVGK